MKRGLSQLEWIAIATMALLLLAAFLYASFTGTVDDVLDDLNDTAEKSEEETGSLLKNPLQSSFGGGGPIAGVHVEGAVYGGG